MGMACMGVISAGPWWGISPSSLNVLSEMIVANWCGW